MVKSLFEIASTIRLIAGAIIFIITDFFNGGEGFIGAILYIVANVIKLFISIKVGSRSYLGSFMLALTPFWLINSVFVTILLLLQLALTVLILIPPFILFLIDLIQLKDNGKKQWSIYQLYYKYIHANEVSPNNWHTLNTRNRPTTTIGNLFLFRPCPQRYIHQKGMFCQPIKDYMPSLPAQANLYNLANQEKVKGPVTPTLITQTLRYKLANDQKKAEMLEEYTRELKRYYEETNTQMKPYDTISKNICRGCTSENNTIQQACYQTYCTNGRWENFCHKYSVTPKPYLKFAEQEPIPKYSFYSIVAILITLSLLIFVNSLVDGEFMYA